VDPNPEMTEELLRRLDRLARLEALVQRAEVFYAEQHHDWPGGMCAIFQDLLEAKKDLVNYETHQVEKLGSMIALDRDPEALNI
jgi:hypothetical protein